MRTSVVSLVTLTALALASAAYFPAIGYPFSLAALIAWGTNAEERAREDRVVRHRSNTKQGG